MTPLPCAGRAVDRRLWLLVSPLLPVGGFSYSQGLEHGVATGAIRTVDDCREWIIGQLEHTLPLTDGAICARLHAAAEREDPAALAFWNAELLSWRDTAELRAQERAQGAALLRVLAVWNERTLAATLVDPTLAATLAAVTARWRIEVDDTVAALFWIWIESQVLAATKCVPLGQSDAQALSWQAMMRLDDVVIQALECADADIGSSACGVALHSALHETQFARQYQS